MDIKKKMNKKAGIPDGIFYLVAIFTVAIISIVGYLILDNVNTHFSESSAISQQGKDLTASIHSKYVSIIDGAFLMIFIGVLIGTLVGVWFIKTHPAMFWISIPLFAFIIFMAAIYANVFYNIENSDQIVDSASQFTIIPFIMEHYVHIIAVAVVLIAIMLFSKGKYIVA